MGAIAESTLKSFEGKGKEFNKIGSSMVRKLDDGVHSESLKVTDLIRNIANSMKEMFSSGDFKSIGGNVIEGIVDRLSGAGGRLADSISNIAKGIIKSFKKIFRNTFTLQSIF